MEGIMTSVTPVRGAVLGAAILAVAVPADRTLAQGEPMPDLAREEFVAPVSKRMVFFELFGNGGLYSVNYEHRLGERTGLRIGFARWTADDWFGGDSRKLWTLPVTVSWIPESGRSGPELGVGLVIGGNHYLSDDGTRWSEGRTRALTGIAGYRWQRGERMVFRVGLTPFLSLVRGENTYPDEGLVPSIGGSVGFRF
jgi:hypothetical protein